MVSQAQLAERVNYFVEKGAAVLPTSPVHAHVDGPMYVYLPDELLVAEEDRASTERLLGNAFRARGTRPVPPGLGTIRLAPGRDAFAMAAELVVDGRRVAAPHMVLTSGTHWSWGSATDPTPAPPLGAAIINKGGHHVAVVDTGMFQPIPGGMGVGIFEPDPIDVKAPIGFVDWFGAGHGGFVAGVIDHHAKGSTIDVYRGFDASVNVPTETAIISAVDRALAGGANVVNLSVGTYGAFGDPPVGLLHAMRRWQGSHPELLIVAAAGNDGLSDPWYPAGFAAMEEFSRCVVSVGATDTKGAPASFSNHGHWVNAWAPGVDVHSHYPKAKRFQYAGGGIGFFADGFALWSGTSFAAPYALAKILGHADSITPLQAWADLASSGATKFA